jgi:hypothetical protein
LKPRDLAVLAAVAILALFAAVDAFRTSPADAPPAARARPAPAPPGPTSRHVQALMRSDVDLHAVRANRRYCRRDLTVVCFRAGDRRDR